MLKLTIRNITAHKRRLLATSLAVILGVAFLTATLALGDTMRAGFRTQIEQGIGDTAVAVRSTTRLNADEQTGQTGLVDASLVDQLATVAGVADAQPSVEQRDCRSGHHDEAAKPDQRHQRLPPDAHDDRSVLAVVAK